MNVWLGASCQDGLVHHSLVSPVSQLIVRDSLVIQKVMAEQTSANGFLLRKWDFGTAMTIWVTAGLEHRKREDRRVREKGMQTDNVRGKEKGRKDHKKAEDGQRWHEMRWGGGEICQKTDSRGDRKRCYLILRFQSNHVCSSAAPPKELNKIIINCKSPVLYLLLEAHKMKG